MNKSLLVLVGFAGGIIIALIVFAIFLAPNYSANSNDDLSQVVEKVEPAAVSIVATEKLEGLQKLFFGGEKNEDGTADIGGGSGFFVKEDGLIATNEHLLKGENYSVITSGGQEFEAEVVASFPDQDVAFLDIEGNGFPVVDFADEQVKPGQDLFAIGNSLGYYSDSVLAGIVSATDVLIEKNGQEYPEMIQMHMPISHGDSGGPVFNNSGKLVGMMKAFDNRAEAISFAIPAQKIQNLITLTTAESIQ